MYNYIVYPESENKLKTSGLMDKIKAVDRHDENFPSTSRSLFTHDFPVLIQEIRERGYFKTQPKKGKKEYEESLTNFHKTGGKWKIIKNGIKIEEEAEEKSFMLFSGYIASFFLNQDEFWNPEKFGFENIYDLFGSIGAAYVNSQSYEDHKKGHRWQHQFKDGRIFFSEVKGNMHGDLEITREELTPYETLDPLANKVNYRQTLQSDINDIISHHSVEDGLLAILLTYIQQEKIESLFTNKELAAKFLKELEISSDRALYADFGDRIHTPDLLFCRAERNNQKLEGYLTSAGSGHYKISVGENKGLIFAHIKEGSQSYQEGDKKAEFAAKEIDHLVKGLFIQAARQLGRTFVGQLVDVLQYWHGERPNLSI